VEDATGRINDGLEGGQQAVRKVLQSD
jgi:hypothetical protein